MTDVGGTERGGTIKRRRQVHCIDDEMLAFERNGCQSTDESDVPVTPLKKANKTKHSAAAGPNVGAGGQRRRRAIVVSSDADSDSSNDAEVRRGGDALGWSIDRQEVARTVAAADDEDDDDGFIVPDGDLDNEDEDSAELQQTSVDGDDRVDNESCASYDTDTSIERIEFVLGDDQVAAAVAASDPSSSPGANGKDHDAVNKWAAAGQRSGSLLSRLMQRADEQDGEGRSDVVCPPPPAPPLLLSRQPPPRLGAMLAALLNRVDTKLRVLSIPSPAAVASITAASDVSKVAAALAAMAGGGGGDAGSRVFAGRFGGAAAGWAGNEVFSRTARGVRALLERRQMGGQGARETAIGLRWDAGRGKAWMEDVCAGRVVSVKALIAQERDQVAADWSLTSGNVGPFRVRTLAGFRAASDDQRDAMRRIVCSLCQTWDYPPTRVVVVAKTAGDDAGDPLTQPANAAANASQDVKMCRTCAKCGEGLGLAQDWVGLVRAIGNFRGSEALSTDTQERLWSLCACAFLHFETQKDRVLAAVPKGRWGEMGVYVQCGAIDRGGTGASQRLAQRRQRERARRRRQGKLSAGRILGGDAAAGESTQQHPRARSGAAGAALGLLDDSSTSESEPPGKGGPEVPDVKEPQVQQAAPLATSVAATVATSAVTSDSPGRSESPPRPPTQPFIQLRRRCLALEAALSAAETRNAAAIERLSARLENCEKRQMCLAAKLQSRHSEHGA